MEDGSTAPRKVMVVVEPNRESADAVQYALSHAVLDNDTLVLLHVENPNAWKNSLDTLFKKPALSPGWSQRRGSLGSVSEMEGGGDGGEPDFVDSMKRLCVLEQPKVKVVVEKAEMAEGKDKASVILNHSEACKVDLLIIGQKRRRNSILGSRKGLSLRGFDTADYLIENSKCTCIAVQKKGQNAGYILNSKLHKNFWLLA